MQRHFNLTGNAFQMRLANGYVITLQNHGRAMASNLPEADGSMADTLPTMSDEVEAWAWREDDDGYGEPVGYLSPEGVLDYIEEVASLPHRGVATCPHCGGDFFADKGVGDLCGEFCFELDARP